VSPIAQAEMQRTTTPRWTFTDVGDAAVAFVCALAIVFLVGMWVGAEAATKRIQQCTEIAGGMK
jgi:hypothetical protein